MWFLPVSRGMKSSVICRIVYKTQHITFLTSLFIVRRQTHIIKNVKLCSFVNNKNSLVFKIPSCFLFIKIQIHQSAAIVEYMKNGTGKIYILHRSIFHSFHNKNKFNVVFTVLFPFNRIYYQYLFDLCFIYSRTYFEINTSVQIFHFQFMPSIPFLTHFLHYCSSHRIFSASLFNHFDIWDKKNKIFSWTYHFTQNKTTICYLVSVKNELFYNYIQLLNSRQL